MGLFDDLIADADTQPAAEDQPVRNNKLMAFADLVPDDYKPPVFGGTQVLPEQRAPVATGWIGDFLPSLDPKKRRFAHDVVTGIPSFAGDVAVGAFDSEARDLAALEGIPSALTGAGNALAGPLAAGAELFGADIRGTFLDPRIRRDFSQGGMFGDDTAAYVEQLKAAGTNDALSKVVTTVGSLAPTIAAAPIRIGSTALGALAPAAAAGGIQSGGSSYLENRLAGVDPDLARRVALTRGAITTLTTLATGPGGVEAFAKTTPVVRTAMTKLARAKAAGGEIAAGAANEIVQEAADEITGGWAEAKLKGEEYSLTAQELAELMVISGLLGGAGEVSLSPRETAPLNQRLQEISAKIPAEKLAELDQDPELRAQVESQLEALTVDEVAVPEPVASTEPAQNAAANGPNLEAFTNAAQLSPNNVDFGALVDEAQAKQQQPTATPDTDAAELDALKKLLADSGADAESLADLRLDEARVAVQELPAADSLIQPKGEGNFGPDIDVGTKQPKADLAKGRGGWARFPDHLESAGVQRANMPQIQSGQRGALANFLRARGVAFERSEALPTALKPTQAEYNPAKVRKARQWDGEERAILVASDGYIVDGHHQWAKNLTDNPDAPMPIVRLGGSIDEVLPLVREFPSASAEAGETAATATADADAGTTDVMPSTNNFMAGDQATVKESLTVPAAENGGFAVGQRVEATKGKIKGTVFSVERVLEDGRLILRDENGRLKGGKTGVTPGNFAVVGEGAADHLPDAKKMMADEPEAPPVYDDRAERKLPPGFVLNHVGPTLGENGISNEEWARIKGGTVMAVVRSPIKAQEGYGATEREAIDDALRRHGVQLSTKDAAPVDDTEARMARAKAKAQERFAAAQGKQEAAKAKTAEASADMLAALDKMKSILKGKGPMGSNAAPLFEAAWELSSAAVRAGIGKFSEMVAAIEVHAADVARQKAFQDALEMAWDAMVEEEVPGMQARDGSAAAVLGAPESAQENTPISNDKAYNTSKDNSNATDGPTGIEQGDMAPDGDSGPDLLGRSGNGVSDSGGAGRSAGRDGENAIGSGSQRDANESKPKPTQDTGKGRDSQGVLDNSGNESSPDDDAESGAGVAGAGGDGDLQRVPARSRKPGKRSGGKRGGRASDAGGIGARGLSTESAPLAPTVGRSDFHLADPLAIVGASGAKKRFARNRAAIEAAQAAQGANRNPTEAEQLAIAGYIGWGSFGQELFQGTWDRPQPADGWTAEDAWLRDSLGQEAWESAQASIVNAHYTDPPTVEAMWAAVRKLGFTGGRVLEPSSGIGNFLALQPRDLHGKSQWTAIELDQQTGAMAAMLHPNANVRIMGYQESHTADNFYDLAIGNVPFGNFSVADARYDRFKAPIHNYFFMKALDQVRPGGLVAFITSSFTMDGKKAQRQRAYLNGIGELVGAFRLPTGAFEGYAGTKVVTDLIILQKREPGERGDPKAAWVGEPVAVETPGGTVHVNAYFAQNPDHILGKLNRGHGTTFMGAGMIVDRQPDFADRLAAIPEMLPAGIMTERSGPKAAARYIANHTDQRQGTAVIQGNDVFVVEGDHLREDATWKVKDQKKTAQRLTQMKGLLNIRSAYGELLNVQREGSQKDIDAGLKNLNRVYDAFVDKHGPINNSEGYKALDRIKDANVEQLAALEALEDGLWVKRPVFVKAQIRARAKDTKMALGDALAVMRNESLQFNAARVAELAQMSEAEVIQQLVDQERIYLTPTGDYEAADIYLSGNVRLKLRELRAAQAEGIEGLERSMAAVERVIPKTIPYTSIEVKLGATWVTSDDYAGFLGHLLNEPADSFRVDRLPNAWKVIFQRKGINDKAEAVATWGHKRVPFSRLMNAAINHQSVTVRDKYVEDGTVKEEVNVEETKAANEQIEKIKEAFREWIWDDAVRAVRLEESYNETFNAVATPKYDGSHLALEGLALLRGDSPFAFRQHQLDAVWRGLVTGRGLYAHEVGTGKTYTMGALAIESRRLGMAQKPLLFAHNANSKTVMEDIQQAYPAARILFVDNLNPKERDARMQQIAMDDWDLVVMPHSLLDRLTLRPETVKMLLREEIEAMEEAAMAAAADDDVNEEDVQALFDLGDDIDLDTSDKGVRKMMSKIKSPTAKELVKARFRLTAQIERAAQLAQRNAVAIEDLGVDMLMVDEAHIFKKLPISTKMKIKGLNTTASKAGTMMMLLADYIRGNNQGRGVHLFTGTPITNTVNEIYNMQRLVMREDMRKDGIESWDGWFNAFAQSSDEVELTSGGTWDTVTRLNAFINVPELRRMVGTVMDTVFASDMPEFIDRPRRDGREDQPVGRPFKEIIIDTAPMDAVQAEQAQELRDRYARWTNASKMSRKKMMLSGADEVPIMIETEGSKSAMDPRMMDIKASGAAESLKVNRAVKNIFKELQENPEATQMIFMQAGYASTAERSNRTAERDPVTGKRPTMTVETFNMAQEIVDLLTAQGMPREQIAVFSWESSREKRAELAEKMNRGEIRVAIGSSETMGTGVNAQRLLVAGHHLDAPWMPGHMEQRNGRFHRQGNEWNTVREYRYITEGSHDGRRWQVVLTKSRFITQFMRDDLGDVRVIEGDAVNVDEEGGDSEGFAATFGAAAGDPRIMVRTKIEKQVDKLEGAKRRHGQGQVRAQNDVQTLTRQIQEIEQQTEQLIADRDAFAAVADAPFAMTIQGKTYTERKDADAALKKLGETVDLVGVGLQKVVGSYRGFKVEARNNKSAVNAVSLVGETFHPATWSVASFDTRLRFIARQAQQRQAEVEQLQVSKRSVESLIGKPFARESDLRARKKQLADLIEDLQQNPEPAPSWLRDSAPMGSTVVVDGKAYAVAGHRVSDDGYMVLIEDGENTRAVPIHQVHDEGGGRLFANRPAAPVRAVQRTEAEKEHGFTHGEQISHKGQSATVRRVDDDGTIELEMADGAIEQVYASDLKPGDKRQFAPQRVFAPDPEMVIENLIEQALVQREKRIAALKKRLAKAGTDEIRAMIEETLAIYEGVDPFEMATHMREYPNHYRQNHSNRDAVNIFHERHNRPPTMPRIQPDGIANTETWRAPSIRGMLVDVQRDLRKADRSAPKLTVDRGALPDDAGGAFDPDNYQLTSAVHNDLDTVAHEVGHWLGFRYGLDGAVDDIQIRRELAPFAAHGTMERNPGRMAHEGVAEWIRAWIINPVEADAAAPLFAEQFKRHVSVDVMQALRAYGDKVRQWWASSAAGKVDSAMDSAKDAFTDLKRDAAWHRRFLRGLGSIFGIGRKRPMRQKGQPPRFEASKYDRAKHLISDHEAPQVSNYSLSLMLQGKDPEKMNPNEHWDFVRKMMRGQASRVSKGIIEQGLVNVDKTRAKFSNGQLMTIGNFVSDLMEAGGDKWDELLDKAHAYGVAQRTGEIAARLRAEHERAMEKRKKALFEDAGTDVLKARKAGEIYRDEKAKGEAELAKKLSKLTGAGGGLLAADSVAEKARRELENDPDKKAIYAYLDKYRQWAAWNIDYLVASEMLSPNTAAAMRKNNEFYIDWHRMFGEDDGLINVGEAVEGSTRTLHNPLASLLFSSWSAVVRGDHNRLMGLFTDPLRVGVTTPGGRAIADLGHIVSPEAAEEAITKHKGYIDDPALGRSKVYRVKRLEPVLDAEGDPIFDDISGEMLIESITEHWVFEAGTEASIEAGREYDNGVLMSVLKGLTSIQRTMIVTSPSFRFRMLWRDNIEQILLTENGALGSLARVFKRSGKDVIEGRTIDDWFTAYGADMAGLTGQDREALMADVFAETERLRKGKKFLLSPAAAFKWWEKVGQSAENHARKREFAMSMRKHIAQGMPAEWAAAKAAIDSRELMDAAARGKIVGQLNGTTLFLMASVTGFLRTTRDLRKAAKLAKQGDMAGSARALSATLIRVGTYGSVLMVARMMLLGMMDDDELEAELQRPAWKRDTTFIIPERLHGVPGVGDIGIAKPYEMGWAASGFERLADYMVGHARGVKGQTLARSYEGYAKSFAAAVFPVDQDILAPGTVGLIEVATNYSLFMGRPIVSPWEAGLDLKLRKGQENASGLGQLLGKIAQVDARNVDHLIRSYAGSWGSMAISKDFTELAKRTTGASGYTSPWQDRDVAWVLERSAALGIDRQKAFKDLRAAIRKAQESGSDTARAAVIRRAKQMRDYLERDR